MQGGEIYIGRKKQKTKTNNQSCNEHSPSARGLPSTRLQTLKDVDQGVDTQSSMAEKREKQPEAHVGSLGNSHSVQAREKEATCPARVHRAQKNKLAIFSSALQYLIPLS